MYIIRKVNKPFKKVNELKKIYSFYDFKFSFLVFNLALSLLFNSISQYLFSVYF